MSAALAMAASAAKKGGDQVMRVVRQSSGFLVPLLLLGGGFLYLRGRARQAAMRKAERELGTNYHAALAGQFLEAIDPGGGGRLIKAALGLFPFIAIGKELFRRSRNDAYGGCRELVSYVRDWPETVDFYRKLSKGRSLVADMQDKLKPAEFQDVMKRLDQRKAYLEDERTMAENRLGREDQGIAMVKEKVLSQGQPGKVYTWSYRWKVQAKRQTSIYPGMDNRGATRRVKAGEALGTLTGRFGTNGRKVFMELPSGWVIIDDLTIMTDG